MIELWHILQQFGSGIFITLSISIGALLLGLILSITLTGCELSRFWILRVPVIGYTAFVRSVPEILIIFSLFFSVDFVFKSLGFGLIPPNPMLVGIIALSIIFSAYATQIFVGTYRNLPKGQLEACDIFGLSLTTKIFQIILPQVFRYSLPALNNLWLVLLKDSALVSLVGIGDLIYEAQMAAIQTGKPFNLFIVVALIYLGVTYFSEIFSKKLQRLLNKPYAENVYLC
ncbi:MAG: ABC transporter permease subunit [Gammaproteobacteria bacterium]